MRIILSNSNTGGGIAFNVEKISKELNEFEHKSTQAVYLNLTSLFSFCMSNLKGEKLKIYTTSAKTLLYSAILTLIRFFLLKETSICQIIYHPRFIDPNGSKFRLLLRSAVKGLGLNNVLYYSTECIRASQLEPITDVKGDRLIGLASVFGDVNEEEYKSLKYKEFLNHKFEYKISTVGRFVNFKFGYLKGLIEFAKRNPNVGLLIVGYGPLEKKLRYLSNDAENIYFFGEQGIEKTKSIVKSSDIYIGMGTTLVDANSVGIPALIAIESDSESISSGFFGDSNNINFGEFNKKENYNSIDDYLGGFKVTECDNIKGYEVKPWIRIYKNEIKLSPMTLSQTVMIIFKLIVAKVIKVFPEKDYH